MGEISAADRAVHVVLGCVVCSNPDKWDEPDQPHSCCDTCGIAYFADGRYYQERMHECTSIRCDGRMYYG